jgi:predicted esterase
MIKHIQIQRHLRYALSGKVKDPTELFVAFHGYGQLAPYFIRKFSDLNERFLLLVPEGPHRFYLAGSSGRVGASWMTKEDRETDIEDNKHFLNELLELVLTEYPSIERIHVLGFSQGAATAARWVQHTYHEINSVILWATVFPPDLEEVPFKSGIKLFFAIGNNDPYYPNEKAIELQTSHEKKGFQTFLFEGNHDIDIKTLQLIISHF